MRALFVSGDKTILDASSQSAARMRAYAAACEALYVVVAGAAGSYASGRLTVRGVPASALTRLFVLPPVIRDLVREQRIEVVSAQDPFEYGLSAYYGTRHTGAALHLQIHTDFLSPEFVRNDPLPNSVRVRIADWLLPKAAGIRAVSARIRDSVRARYENRACDPDVIPIQVPSAAAQTSWQAPFAFTLMTIARLEREKNLDTLIRAMRGVHRKYPQAGVVIVGDGRRRKQLERLARSLGLGDAVVFLGARADAAALLEAVTAYAQTSAYEGYGMALIEAARAGLPIISTDVGIIGEVLVPGRDALVVPQRDAAALTSAIIRLIEDTHLRDMIRLSAQGAAKEHLRSARQEEQIIENLRRACTAGKGTGVLAGV